MLLYGIGYVDGAVIFLFPGYVSWMVDLAWGLTLSALAVRIVRATISLIP